MPDLYKTVSPEFKNAGDVIYLLGETHNELGASEYYKLLAKQNKNNALGNRAPEVNLTKNLKIYKAIEKAIEKELIASSISLTAGGLAIGLAKACVGGMLGCNVFLNPIGKTYGVDVKLFSESQGRILVSVSPKNVSAFEKIVKHIPYVKLGKIERNGKIIIMDGNKKIIDTNVKKLYTIYHKFSESMR